MNSFVSLSLLFLWLASLISCVSAVKLLLATDQEECVKASLYTDEVQVRFLRTFSAIAAERSSFCLVVARSTL